MNRKTKKGFTITELVIVIAVIAILAAVLIPTFSNVIANSKKSHDEQYVKEINVALANYTVSHGNHAPKDYESLMLALAEYDLCDTMNPFLLATALKQENMFILWYPESNQVILMENGVSSDYQVTYSSAVGLGNGVRVFAKTGDGGTQIGYRLCSTGDSDGQYVADLYKQIYIEHGGDITQFLAAVGGSSAVAGEINGNVVDGAWGSAIIGALNNQKQGYAYSESIANNLLAQATMTSSLSVSVTTTAEAITDGTTAQETRAVLATLTTLANSTATAEKLSGKTISLADNSTALKDVTVDMSEVQMTSIGNVYRKDYSKNNVNTESFSMDFCGLTIDNMTVAANELVSSGAEWQTESDCSYPGGAYVFCYGLFGTVNAGSGTVTISNLNVTNVNMDLDAQTDTINGQKVNIATDMAGVVCAYTQGNVVFENIHISGKQSDGSNGIFKGFDGVAGLVGRIYPTYVNGKGVATTAVIRNCSIENLDIQGQRRACGLVGYVTSNVSLTIQDTTLKNMNILCKRIDGGTGMYSGAIGHLGNGNIKVNGLYIENVKTEVSLTLSGLPTTLNDSNFANVATQINYVFISNTDGTKFALLYADNWSNVTLEGNGVSITTADLEKATDKSLFTYKVPKTA